MAISAAKLQPLASEDTLLRNYRVEQRGDGKYLLLLSDNWPGLPYKTKQLCAVELTSAANKVRHWLTIYPMQDNVIDPTHVLLARPLRDREFIKEMSRALRQAGWRNASKSRAERFADAVLERASQENLRTVLVQEFERFRRKSRVTE